MGILIPSCDYIFWGGSHVKPSVKTSFHCARLAQGVKMSDELVKAHLWDPQTTQKSSSHLSYSPAQQRCCWWWGGILVSLRPSIHPSIHSSHRPSVAPSVSPSVRLTCRVRSTVLDRFFPYFSQIITSREVACNNLRPWPISSRSLSHDFAVKLLKYGTIKCPLCSMYSSGLILNSIFGTNYH